MVRPVAGQVVSEVRNNGIAHFRRLPSPPLHESKMYSIITDTHPAPIYWMAPGWRPLLLYSSNGTHGGTVIYSLEEHFAEAASFSEFMMQYSVGAFKFC